MPRTAVPCRLAMANGCRWSWLASPRGDRVFYALATPRGAIIRRLSDEERNLSELTAL